MKITKEEKKDIEIKFIGSMIETLSVVKAAIEKDVANTWLLDGGLDSWLNDASVIYETILRIETNENQ